MSSFEKALDVLLSWEGGYSCNPRDPGGETYCGISRKKWPAWVGWKDIDAVKERRRQVVVGQHKISWNEKFKALEGLVATFYLQNFWNSYFEKINDQDVCDKLFQHYVNMGSRAIKFCQTTWYPQINDDGVLGMVTVSKLNKTDSKAFLDGYTYKLKAYYEELIKEHPQLHVFEDEWLLRARTIGNRPS